MRNFSALEKLSHAEKLFPVYSEKTFLAEKLFHAWRTFWCWETFSHQEMFSRWGAFSRREIFLQLRNFSTFEGVVFRFYFYVSECTRLMCGRMRFGLFSGLLFLYRQAQVWLHQDAALSVNFVYKVHCTRYRVSSYLWRNKLYWNVVVSHIINSTTEAMKYLRHYSEAFHKKLLKEIIEGSFSRNWLAWLKFANCNNLSFLMAKLFFVFKCWCINLEKHHYQQQLLPEILFSSFSPLNYETFCKTLWTKRLLPEMWLVFVLPVRINRFSESSDSMQKILLKGQWKHLIVVSLV